MSPSSSRSTIFICYSRNDQDPFLKKFQTHLKSLERNHEIDPWDDTKIQPGVLWHQEIKEAIQRAQAAVLLVSANFLASEFIALHELPPLLLAARNEGMLILPVLVSACDYEDSIVSQFQFVNDPSKPLNCLSGGEQEIVWSQVAKNIRLAFSTLNPPAFSTSIVVDGHEEKRKTSANLACREVMSILSNRATNNEKRTSILFMIADMADDLDEVGKDYVRGRLHRIHAEETSDLIRGYIILVLGALDDLTVFSDVKIEFSHLFANLPSGLQKRIVSYIAQQGLS